VMNLWLLYTAVQNCNCESVNSDSAVNCVMGLWLLYTAVQNFNCDGVNSDCQQLTV